MRGSRGVPPLGFNGERRGREKRKAPHRCRGHRFRLVFLMSGAGGSLALVVSEPYPAF